MSTQALCQTRGDVTETAGQGEPAGRSMSAMTPSHPRAGSGVLAALMSAALLLSGCADGDADAPSVEEVSPTSTSEPGGQATEVTESADTEKTSDAQPTGPQPADSDLITDLAMCGDDTYDEDSDACPGMDADFTTPALHCTAQAQLEEAGPLEVRFYRNGGLAFVAAAEIPQEAVGTQAPLFADVNVGELDLPGGDWTCEMQIGASTRETGQTSVNGPAERFSSGRACNNADTFSAQGVTHCTSDVPTLQTNTEEIGCSAVLTDTLDAEMEIRAEWETDAEGAGERSLGSVNSPAGILVAHGFMTSQAVTGTAEFAPGTYRCRFLVDGEDVGAHEFTVG
ncbi:hypothetical protein BH23ACT6_BH23ACT6_00220 [soil metagenome]